MSRVLVIVALVLACGSSATDRITADQRVGSNVVRVPGDDAMLAVNASGIARTVTATGSIDPGNAFFQSLGTNGRACVSCHVASDGWTITPPSVAARFEATDGTDPVFRLNDGATSPLADVSTKEARRSAYALLLSKALIRVGIGIPDGAEFELLTVDDPYGYASAKELSLFRRPLPSANLGFLSAVMWDGRETLTGMSIRQDLAHQANGATQGHAQAPDPIDEATREEIVGFETGIYFAQAVSFGPGRLDLLGARGGPEALAATPFYLGINDTLGGDPTGQPFTPTAMTLFTPWTDSSDGQRAAIARGEALFNQRSFEISGVRGLNDALGTPSLRGTCTTCHNTPEVGNHSVALPLDLGLTDAGRRTPDLPLYTLRNRQTGEVLQTTDPGRALITGKWSDVSRFKGPILRGLAARPPYFHNGSAATLTDVVAFYDQRFGIGFTSDEKTDLVAFLGSL